MESAAPLWSLLYKSVFENLLSSYTGSEEEIRIPDSVIFNRDNAVEWYCTPDEQIGISSPLSLSSVSPFVCFIPFFISPLFDIGVYKRSIVDTQNELIYQKFLKLSNETAILAQMIWYEGEKVQIGYLDQHDLKSLLFCKTTAPLPDCWLLQQIVVPKAKHSTIVCEIVAGKPVSVYNIGLSLYIIYIYIYIYMTLTLSLFVSSKPSSLFHAS